jgi:hypothetical protein
MATSSPETIYVPRYISPDEIVKSFTNGCTENNPPKEPDPIFFPSLYFPPARKSIQGNVKEVGTGQRETDEEHRRKRKDVCTRQ